MTKIKIDIKNRAAIEAALAAVNGRATSFTITSYLDVEGYANSAEKQLAASQLPKNERSGVTAVATPAGPSANAYKYAAKSTSIRIQRGATGWFLLGVSETSVYPRQSERLSLTITPKQRDTIAAKAVAGYYVSMPTAPAQALAHVVGEIHTEH